MASVGFPASRYQCWWHSELLGWRCDAYPTPDQALSRLREVEHREHFTRGLAIDIEEHLTGQDEHLTHREFEEAHRRFTEDYTNA